MRQARVGAWIWLTAGILYVGLTGLCTLNVYMSPENYGLWVIGLLIVAPGLLPIWIGWRRLRRP